MAEPLVGLREAARQVGVSHSTLSRQLAAGVFPNHGSGGQVLLRVSEIRAGRAGNLDRTKQRGPDATLFAGLDPDEAAAADSGADPSPAAPGATPKLSDSRAEHEAVKVLSARIGLETKLRTLYAVPAVNTAAIEAAQAIREGLAMRNRDLAEQLAPLSSVPEILSALGAADDALLNRLADTIQRGLQEAIAE